MIHESVATCVGKTPLVYLRRLFPQPDIDVIAKLELLNPGGSIKDRPARYIVEQGLQDGTIRSGQPGGTHLIESTSGNLGIALAMMAKVHGLEFTCVVDPKITASNLRILTSLGARIDMVYTPDDQGGYLKTRIERVKELLRTIPNSLWINQYANERNWQAHYHGEGAEILDDLDGRRVDCLVAGVSTTGTIHGISRRLRREFPGLRVIAVDAAGSAIFAAPPAARALPGLGASRSPELLRRDEIDDIIYVTDWESMLGCRALAAREGILAGGSSGAAVAAIRKMLPALPRPYRVLTLLPDRGERYLDMVYDEQWAARLTRRAAELPASLARARAGQPLSPASRED